MLVWLMKEVVGKSEMHQGRGFAAEGSYARQLVHAKF